MLSLIHNKIVSLLYFFTLTYTMKISLCILSSKSWLCQKHLFKKTKFKAHGRGLNRKFWGENSSSPVRSIHPSEAQYWNFVIPNLARKQNKMANPGLFSIQYLDFFYIQYFFEFFKIILANKHMDLLPVLSICIS